MDENRMKAILIVMVAALALCGCDGTRENIVKADTYTDDDFQVVCLYGYNYIIRNAGGKAVMSVKYNFVTGFPEKCDK